MYETSLYSKLLLILFGEYFLIENENPAIFMELHLWTARTPNFLADNFNNRLGFLVESGIIGYQNHYLEVLTQRLAIGHIMFVKKSTQQHNWFSLVIQMISRNTPFGFYSAAKHHILQSLQQSHDDVAKTDDSGTMTGFKYMWIFFCPVMILVVKVFLLEMISSICLWYYKIIIGKFIV